MIRDEPLPPDASARERIVTNVDHTLFVDAGAGSGKTTQLVERVVQLVRRGVPIDHIAAITFTEAAAAELRDRIRHRLSAAGEEARTAEERASLRAAADRADEASIQTLHAFAQSILRAHPVEAGLPPAVEVADEITSVLAFERRFEEFRDRLFDDDSMRPLLRRFLLLGLKEKDLRSLAAVFNDNWDRIPRQWDADLDPPLLPSLDVTAILEALHDALDRRDQCSDPDDRLLAFLDGHVADAAAMLERAEGDHVLGVLAGLKRLTTGLGAKGNWNGAKAQVIEALDAAEDDRIALIESNQHVVAESLMKMVGRFVLRSAEERRVDGRLEFHDLLVRARDVLRDHPDVRRQLAARHQRVLVDEFQDTDPLQLDIVSLIAARDGASSIEWNEVAIDAGRVFFVGDPKQSIYRFRRADMKLYTDARSHYGDGLCELSANFRTVPGIIEWVNHTFGQLIVEDDGQPAYFPLDAVRPPLGDGVAPVTVLGGALDGVTANEIRNQSAIELVTVMREMVESGRCVKDGSDTRPMTYGDVVVLVPSRIPVPALEDAFAAADVPYRLETASLIWASQEIREVMSVLRAVDDPGDQISIVAALRTPMLGCSDDDLAAWRTAGGRWGYLGHHDDDGDPAGDEPVVAKALRTLRSLHDQRWWLGPDGLVERLATEHATFQLALLAGRRRDRWRRLRFLADQARSFVESQRGDLSAFVAWADLQSSDIVRVSSPTLPEGDEQAVRVMTIHASKGLEFPVVALFGLGVRVQGYRGVSVIWAPTGPEVRFSSHGGTEGHDALVPAEEQMDRHERMRLLYVAATRAKDRLILCTHHKAAKKTNAATAPFGDLIEQHLPDGRDDLWTRWTPTDLAATPGGSESLPVPAPPDSPEVASAVEARAEFVDDRAALLAAERRAVWSATAVAKASSPEALDTEGEADDRSDDDRPWRRGRAGTAIGRAVHGTLQLVDFDDLSDLDAIARSQAAAEGVDDSVDTVAALARAGAEAPLVRELVARRHWREMYVAAPMDESVVEGYVDLLADDGDGGLVVLDYKTDTVRDEGDVAERTERYRLQAATYALAIEAVTGKAVTRASFLFLGTSGAIEATVDDLEAAKARARAVLDGPA